MVSILLRNQKLWDGWCQEVGTPNPVLQVKLKGKCCPCSPGVSGTFWRGFWDRMGGRGRCFGPEAARRRCGAGAHSTLCCPPRRCPGPSRGPSRLLGNAGNVSQGLGERPRARVSGLRRAPPPRPRPARPRRSALAALPAASPRCPRCPRSSVSRSWSLRLLPASQSRGHARL